MIFDTKFNVKNIRINLAYRLNIIKFVLFKPSYVHINTMQCHKSYDGFWKGIKFSFLVLFFNSIKILI